MLTQITDRIPPLSVLIPALLTVWAVACTLLHGPAILAYVALQAATSGIFALSMYRISRLHSQPSAKPSGNAVAADEDSVSNNDKRPASVS